jgi:xanthine dehydrogenase/oxidase
MSMYSLLRTTQKPPTQHEIEESLAGNLCRCTGYRPILDAFRVFAKNEPSLYTDEAIHAAAGGVLPSSGSHKKGGVAGICPSTGNPCDCGKPAELQSKNGYVEHKSQEETGKKTAASNRSISTDHYGKDNIVPTKAEPIFPPELVSRKASSLVLSGAHGLMWYRPTNLNQLLDLKVRYPHAKLVGGNTEVGIETRFKNLHYPVLLAVTHVPELLGTKVRDDGLEVGASVTLTKLLELLQEMVKVQKEYKTASCKAFIEQLRWFAGAQIRNVSSIGGNICTASPISDLNPLWIAAGASFTVVSQGQCSRTVDAKDFFLGYRKVNLQKTEILASVFLPWTRPFEYVKEFKQAHRRDDDIALVNAGLRVALTQIDGAGWFVKEISLAYGGVAAMVLCATKTQEFLKGKPWNQQTLDQALSYLQKEIVIASNAPGGMVEFRRSLISSFFFKFFLFTTYKLEADASFVHGLPESYRSAVAQYIKEPSHGVQLFQTLSNGTAVGLPLQHQSASLQVTGEAEYVDDIAMPLHGLHAGLVLSTRPHARIVSIDSSEAEKQPGFEGFFSAKDVPGANDIGAIVHDEEVFATKTVTCVGQVIGIVVADTHENAKDAARKVRVEYEDIPAVLDMDQAVATGSFHPGSGRVLEIGDPDSFFSDTAIHSEDIQILEGDVRMGGQEHFYLEPMSSLVWTTDAGNEVHMVSSTQVLSSNSPFVYILSDNN